jgi:hypothetical protein
MRETRRDGDANRDPITGAPGSHPVGTGVGALGGAAAGAAAGTAVGGPLGTVVGGAIGAVAGGLAGKGIAEMVDPTVEDAYWRASYRDEPYYVDGYTYDDTYQPAYRAGWEGRVKYDGRAFDEVEDDLRADYEGYRGNDMSWQEVRPATRAAWDRVDRRVESLSGN